jgi:hypothetical protein
MRRRGEREKERERKEQEEEEGGRLTLSSVVVVVEKKKKNFLLLLLLSQETMETRTKELPSFEALYDPGQTTVSRVLEDAREKLGWEPAAALKR